MQEFRRMHLIVGVTLALLSTMTIASMGDTAEAAEEGAEPAPLTDVVAESSLDEAEDIDAAVLAWMENEMQMSIDLSEAPQGFIPDYTCIEPPLNCPANVKCPELGNAHCIVTSCGKGECPTCPKLIPGAVITSWCAYGCMKGSKVVGGAYGFWARFLGWLGPVCFPG